MPTSTLTALDCSSVSFRFLDPRQTQHLDQNFRCLDPALWNEPSGSSRNCSELLISSVSWYENTNSDFAIRQPRVTKPLCLWNPFQSEFSAQFSAYSNLCLFCLPRFNKMQDCARIFSKRWDFKLWSSKFAETKAHVRRRVTQCNRRAIAVQSPCNSPPGSWSDSHSGEKSPWAIRCNPTENDLTGISLNLRFRTWIFERFLF